MAKPPRTLGISLAILSGMVFFSCLPLVQASILLWLRSQSQLDFVPQGLNSDLPPSIVGADVLQVEAVPLMIQIVIAVAFAAIAFLTWRGKPSFMRFVFVGAVLVLTAGNVAEAVSLLTQPLPSIQTGIDSASDYERFITLARLCLSLAIPAYIVWYLNRGPARAFFRGYHLQNSAAPHHGPHD